MGIQYIKRIELLLGRCLTHVVGGMVRFGLGPLPKVWGTPVVCRVSFVGGRGKALRKVFLLFQSSLNPERSRRLTESGVRGTNTCTCENPRRTGVSPLRVPGFPTVD